MNKHYCDICGKEITGEWYKVEFIFHYADGDMKKIREEYCSTECYTTGINRRITELGISYIHIFGRADWQDEW